MREKLEALKRGQAKPSRPAVGGKEVAMGPRPSSTSISSEISRDDRFIAYDNSTVLDTRTNLIWAAKDNGSNVNWANAKSYCENYRGGGGCTDWWMPTQDELAGLYDDSGNYKNVITITTTSRWVWASERRGSDAAVFIFFNGLRFWLPQSKASFTRALPVRSGK